MRIVDALDIADQTGERYLNQVVAKWRDGPLT